MDFYNDLESFLEAYLYFDNVSHKILDRQTPHHDDDFEKHGSNCNVNLFDLDSGLPQIHQPNECESSRNIFQSLTPSEPKLFHHKSTQEEPKTLNGPMHFHENENCNCIFTGNLQQSSSSQCWFTCSDPIPMTYHELTFHDEITATNFNGNLTKPVYWSMEQEQNNQYHSQSDSDRNAGFYASNFYNSENQQYFRHSVLQ